MIINWELVRKLLMRGIQKWHCLSFPVWSFSSYDFLKYFFVIFGQRYFNADSSLVILALIWLLYSYHLPLSSPLH